jgi:hypothetical protein
MVLAPGPCSSHPEAAQTVSNLDPCYWMDSVGRETVWLQEGAWNGPHSPVEHPWPATTRISARPVDLSSAPIRIFGTPQGALRRLQQIIVRITPVARFSRAKYKYVLICCVARAHNKSVFFLLISFLPRRVARSTQIAQSSMTTRLIVVMQR